MGEKWNLLFVGGIVGENGQVCYLLNAVKFQVFAESHQESPALPIRGYLEQIF